VARWYYHRPGRTGLRLCGLALRAVRGFKAQVSESAVVKGNRVKYDGVEYALDDGPADFVAQLVAAGVGVWVSSASMGLTVHPRPDRVFRKIKRDHPEIAEQIESRTGAGYRIRPR